MDYYFTNFQFNGLTLLLMKDGQSLPIRNNEAKLLAFFLANPDQVFSKDAILENVWTGKVVSEQAVFQAISNLRSLFGDEAIKPIPKRLSVAAPVAVGTFVPGLHRKRLRR